MAMVSGVRAFRGIVYIEIDGTRFAGIRKCDFERIPLAEGDAVDEEDYIMRIAAIQSKHAYEAGLSSLDYANRTSVEIRRALLRKGFVEMAADAAVERLSEAGLIDDARYAERMVELHANKSIGIHALKRKMRQKGIDEDTVDEALEAVDEEDQLRSAKKLVETLMPRYAGVEPRAQKAKISAALARRGYDWDTVSSALSEVFDEEFE